MAKKEIKRIKKPDEIVYYGDAIRIQKYDNDSEVSIWVTNRGQMPSYSRIDMGMKALKELSDILPDLIKEIEG